jgi:hypothetical protein
VQVGVGHNWQYYDGPFGFIGRLPDSWVTWQFEKHGKSDFIGLHYYSRITLPNYRARRKGRVWSDKRDFGDIYPEGIRSVLDRMHKKYPKKPIFVSEIGFSDRTDAKRPYWLLKTLEEIAHAERQGLPIKGILIWSLVNNFEWNEGMRQKFGLFDETQLYTQLENTRHPHYGPNEDHLPSWEIAKQFGEIRRKNRTLFEGSVKEWAKRQHDECIKEQEIVIGGYLV